LGGPWCPSLFVVVRVPSNFRKIRLRYDSSLRTISCVLGQRRVRLCAFSVLLTTGRWQRKNETAVTLNPPPEFSRREWWSKSTAVVTVG